MVAKCGLFLKQKATTVEGVFRISGSTRRMKELQDIFDRPPSYGRDVVWGPWSVHDAASVLRRYLNQMHVSRHTFFAQVNHDRLFQSHFRNLWYHTSYTTSSGMHCVSTDPKFRTGRLQLTCLSCSSCGQGQGPGCYKCQHITL